MSGRYMLDTNIVSELARNPQGKIARRIAEVGQRAVCVSIITAAELRYGCHRKGSARLSAQIDAILESMPVLPLDVPADAEYGRIRAELEASGKPIGPNDLLIAAHASAIKAVLVTANTREFLRIPAIKVENWLDGTF
ncbi:type II toxin-antitoxin system VapC family toxin [Brucella sp. IR073]|uniref:type II toxin-antitoxin system VapC family toxin n=1 Tax=unclassified Brucella TaxID=2632610 RepID=UPI003B986F40